LVNGQQSREDARAKKNRYFQWKEAPVTSLLVVVLPAIWAAWNLAELASPSLVPRWLGGSGEAVWSGAFAVALLTPLAHHDLWHLALNFLWLPAVGPSLERTFGPALFLAFTALAGFVASSAQLAFSSNTGIGFSGVVYAWLGFMWIARRRHPALGVVNDRVMVMALLWLVGCIVVSRLGMAAIGNAAHAGGLSFGLAVGLALVPGRFRTPARVAAPLLVVLSALSIVYAPWNAHWLLYRSERARDQKNLAESRRFADRALALAPHDVNVVWMHGWLADQMGEPKLAAADYDFVVKRAPRFYDGYLARAHLYYQQKNYAAAVALLDRAAPLDIMRSDAYTRRGMCLLELHEYQRALDDMNAALERNPDDAHALAGRGWARVYLHLDMDAALADFDRAIALRGDRGWAGQGRATLLEQSGKLQEALAEYDSLAKVPGIDRDTVSTNRCFVLWQLGDAARVAQDCGPSAGIKGTLPGLLLHASGDRAGTADWFRKQAEAGDSVYPALWLRWLSGERGPLQAVKVKGWEADLRQHGLGEIDDAELLRLAATAESEYDRRGQLCEAHTYVALAAEQAGRRSEALESYRAALATQRPDFIEDAFARSRLRELDAVH
jgi:GlpG protein